MFTKNIPLLIGILSTLLFLFQLKISESLTSSSESYFVCIGKQGSILSSSNYNLLLELSPPLGASSSLSYKLNLGFIPACMEGFCECNYNLICNSGETQENCPQDCKTEIRINPPQQLAGNEVNITISFSDGRYKHEEGTQIKVGLLVDSLFHWSPSYGCFSNLTIILTSSRTQQTCNWNYETKIIKCGDYPGNMIVTYFPDENKLEIDGKCKLPILPPGYYVVNASISLYLIKR